MHSIDVFKSSCSALNHKNYKLIEMNQKREINTIAHLVHEWFHPDTDIVKLENIYIQFDW